MLDKAKAEVTLLQAQVEATNQQLRLTDRKHKEQRGKLTACKEELAKYKARLEDFEIWDLGDMDTNIRHLEGGIQPSAFEAAEWLNFDKL